MNSEEGLPLHKEEMVEYFSLLFFGAGHRLQNNNNNKKEGFLPQGI